MLAPLIVAYSFLHYGVPSQYEYRRLPSTPRVRAVRNLAYPRRHTAQPTASVTTGLTVRAETLLAASTIPPGAQRVPMLRLELAASCSQAVVIQSVEVQRRGLGERSDIDGVYAVASGQRLSRSRPVSRRNGQVQIPLRGLVIPSCQSRTVDIYADFSPQASVSGQHRFDVVAVDADTSVSISRTQAASAVQTSGRRRGVISVEYLNLTRTVRYGSQRVVSRFRLEADREDDHLLTALTLTNQGTAKHTDLQNLYLESARDGPVTHVEPFLDGDSVRLVFSPPLVLQRSQSRTFALRSDVRSGVRKSIQFIVEEPSDIEAVPVSRRSR